MVVVIFDWDGTIVDSMGSALPLFQDLAKQHFDVEADAAAAVFRRNEGGPTQNMWRQIMALSSHPILAAGQEVGRF